MSSTHYQLPDETLLHVCGADAWTFLQGQLTCDLREVAAGRAAPGVYCSPQGRVLADFLVLQLGQEHYVLRLRRSIAESTKTRLDKYAVFSKVSLSLSGDWSVSACWGEDSAHVIAALGLPVPSGRYGLSHDKQKLWAVQVDTAACQYEIYQHSESTAPAPTTGRPDSWYLLEQQRGMARIEPKTVDEFVPQALSYDLAGFISFNKGCYTGQEVVARLHYKGTPKRRLYLAEVTASAAPEPGDKLFLTAGGRQVGEVVNMTAIAGKRWQLLVSIAKTAIDSDTVQLGEQSEAPRLTLSPPPFGIGDKPEAN